MNAEPAFGRWLRQRRKALDLTCEDLAQQIGCSAVAIYKIESGERRPSKQIAELMADYLEIAPEQRRAFVEWARAKHAGAETPANCRTSSATALWSIARRSPTNLPEPAAPLIGRESELVTLQRRLLRPETRLLTLLGPGGVGKTRLSLAVAAELRDSFADGVFFVPLAPIRDPEVVLMTIAQTLDLKLSGNAPVATGLANPLRNQQMLLVLDNFEQVVHAAPLLTQLLQTCPELKLLVTSRTALRVRVERRFLVAPLPLPTPEHVDDIAALEQTPAVALFVDRARAVQPTFALTRANARAVAEVCTRLDGLPLAIELVAARARVLAPQALLVRLGETARPTSLGLLNNGPSDLPARHRTLHDAIAWSYDLLDPAGKQLFARLGVFVGGWTLAAAEAIACAPGSADELPNLTSSTQSSCQVLDGLERLIDNSLIQVVPESDDPQRFTMLETVREYALEQLRQSGEEDCIRRRHALFYLALAEEAEPLFQGPDQQRWLDRLEAEHPNMRRALRWAIDHAEPEIGARLASALRWLWDMRGYVAEGRHWLEQIIALGYPLPEGDDLEARRAASIWGKLLHVAGVFAHNQTDHEQARAYYEQSLALRRRAQDHKGVASALNNLGIIANDCRNYEQAQALFEEALAVRRAMDDKWGISTALNNLGTVAGFRGDKPAAERYYAESLRIERELGNVEGIAVALSNLAAVAYDCGDDELARARLEESLALRRETGNTAGIAASLRKLGLVFLRQGDYARAQASLAESLALRQALGDRLGIATCLEWLAAVAAAEDPLPTGAQRAARLLGAAAGLRDALGTPIDAALQEAYERVVAAAQARLDAPTWNAAWTFGRGLALDAAVAYALSDDLRDAKRATDNGYHPEMSWVSR